MPTLTLFGHQEPPFFGIGYAECVDISVDTQSCVDILADNRSMQTMSTGRRWVENIVVICILSLIAYAGWSLLGPVSPRPTAEQRKAYEQGDYGRRRGP